ncbi:S9 family peptidase [Chitinophaga nivalis]|uniref:DPP IV N-terminal domain-containing protein n=1 Tax=Chitinophaga nivalis TaxID=2991709 RepID=A0ABT3IHT6_9BACT|nr:DPP IV N-terminal domain-containing protein [Chitinophaga nivalis]MCW3466796.1 DPP IV N-terminal domain-containing protein [Chitinophaga nivalis]MCW3483513.1 DPP IV N-terminal domain-containing protein [Chitinophaga nivalis]
MRKALLLLLTGCVVGGLQFSYAQQRKYTMAEATNGLRQQLAPERVKQFEWLPGENAYSRLVTADGNTAWVKYTVPAGKADTLLSLTALNAQLFSAKPLRALPALHWIAAGTAWFSSGTTLYKGQTDNGRLTFTTWCTLPETAENITVNAASGNIAYTIKNNLFLRTADGTEHAITNDTDSNILNGKSVHREEFGIDKGIFFSPKGNLVAFYRMDQRMVNDYPVINWAVTPAYANIIKYPMAGGKSHEVTLGVYDPATKKTTFLKTAGEADHYLTCVTWAPDQQSIYVALLNRAQNHLWLNQYNAASGEQVKTLLEESDKKYVHPSHPLTFIPNKPDQFIWWSDRDGYAHLYLYNTQGQLQRQLTKGDWIVNELTGFHLPANEVIITTAKESPMEKHAYAVNLKTAAMRRLDTAAGWHDVQLSNDGAYVLDTYSSGTVPGAAQLLALKGKWQQTILTAADPLKDFQRPEIRQVTLKADDGTPLYGKLILPVDFDAAKTYPVIVYLYNGPNVQLIRNTFPYSGNLWYEYMAQHGYVIFTMDGRGSANRGMGFEQATFRQLGTVEMNDQLQGVAYLKTLPFVNQQQMGVHGWSYGGFMTTSLMLRHPGVFKAAVAGGPVIDWSKYEIMYTERYMDTPQENPEGYATANLLTQTKNLQGKLMLIHGTNDDVVVWQHSIDFLKACVDNEVQVDYFVYPGHLHNVLGKDRVHLMQKITDYFEAHLK